MGVQLAKFRNHNVRIEVDDFDGPGEYTVYYMPSAGSKTETLVSKHRTKQAAMKAAKALARQLVSSGYAQIASVHFWPKHLRAKRSSTSLVFRAEAKIQKCVVGIEATSFVAKKRRTSRKR
jgi:hypothetical protein